MSVYVVRSNVRVAAGMLDYKSLVPIELYKIENVWLVFGCDPLEFFTSDSPSPLDWTVATEVPGLDLFHAAEMAGLGEFRDLIHQHIACNQLQTY